MPFVKLLEVMIIDGLSNTFLIASFDSECILLFSTKKIRINETFDSGIFQGVNVYLFLMLLKKIMDTMKFSKWTKSK